MLLTRKSSGTAAPQSRLARSLSGASARTMDRRAFLKRSGVAVGTGAFARPAAVQHDRQGRGAGEEGRRGQDRGQAHGLYALLGRLCDRRRRPERRVGAGAGVRLADQPRRALREGRVGPRARRHRGLAPAEVPDEARQRQVPAHQLGRGAGRDQPEDARAAERIRADSVFIVGSSKHNNEQSELLCKWVRLWGSNNTDHQARICRSTTVAGVANTWGYGAMTNSYNDEQNSKCILFFGSNAAEAHPVSMLHTLHAKENGAKVIVVDPRFTRTAAEADQYYRIRSGADVAFLWGMLYHIFKNGWEDKEYIKARVYGMDKVREEVMKWTPDVVKDVTGMPEGMLAVAEAMAKNRPSTIVWAMGQTNTPTATPSCARAASCSWRSATSASRAAAATSTAAMTTCRARPTSGRIPTRCRATTASPTRSSTGAGCGTSTSSGSRAGSLPA